MARRAIVRKPSAEAAKTLQLENLIRSLQSEISSLPNDTLRDQYTHAIQNLARDGDLQGLLDLTRFRRTPVPLDEFLFGNTYMNLRPGEVYPGVLETLEALDNDDYVECVLKGAIGGGKSTIANLGVIRSLYKISCMRNPQNTFGVQHRSSLVFTIQSVRLSTARKAVFEEMGPFFQNSPYFQDVYPYDKRITSQMIFREQNVSILPVSSSDTGAISLNVIGGVLDELNFMQKVSKSKQDGADIEGVYDQAKTLYLNLSKRRRSRFMQKGKLPGMLFLVSSSRYPDDFTEVKAAEAEMCGGPDPQIYVFSKSLWESKGLHNYNEGWFRVLVGDERTRSRILEDNEVAPATHQTVRVPLDFKGEFIKDVDGSIRDFAGLTTLASRPFFHNREVLYECMSLAEQYGYNPLYTVEDVDLSISVPEPVEKYVRSDVNQMRICHVDLAVTRDSAGLAIAHVAGTKTCERRNPETGQLTYEVLPVIAFDAVLRILPPPNGEIDFAKIRNLIYTLREKYGLPIKVVTTDGFQSTDFRQILAKKGYATDYLSVDRTTQPYVSFRDACYDKRVMLPRHQHLIKEMVELEYVRSGAREKIDHKPRGSKDVADACCGAASYLLTRRASWTTQPLYVGSGGMMLHGNRTHHETIELDPMGEEQWNAIRQNARKRIKRKAPERQGAVPRKRIS